MKCPRCNGDGSVPYHIADDLFDETNCPLCGGSGEVITEREYIQTCNTEQLAEFLLNAIQKCKRCASGIGVADDDDSCPIGGCWEVKDVVEWLKQPHTPKE